MADEVSLSFVVPGEPAAVLAAWRASTPAVLVDGGYARTDESYESLVFEADVTTRYVKIMMFGFAKTLYRLTFTFRAEGDGATRVTVIGQALEHVRAELAAYVASLAGA